MSTDKKLAQIEIPTLRSRSGCVGDPNLFRRSWRPGHLLRCVQGSGLDLEVEFLGALPGVRIKLSVDFGPREKRWVSLPFEAAVGKVHRLRMTPPAGGLYHFRLQFSLDDGKNWIWDGAPTTRLMVEPRASRGLRMYTFIPAVSGSIADWKKHFESVRVMNFNAIHILPITTMDRSESPYSAKELFAVDPRYLPEGRGGSALQAFEELVVWMREQGLKLCIDLVMNHVGVSGDLATSRPDWMIGDEKKVDAIRRAGCLHNHVWIEWKDLGLIDYDHSDPTIRAEIWEYMDQYALFWARYADFTGGLVRFDNIHSSNEAYMSHLTRRLREAYPEVGLLAEFFADEKLLAVRAPQWQLHLLLAHTWEYKFTPDLRRYLRFIHDNSDDLRYYMPITTHDTGVPAQEFGDARSTLPRYLIVALMGTGCTGLVQGVEAAVGSRIEFIGKQPAMTFKTDPFGEIIARINELLEGYRSFQCSGNLTFVDGDHGAIIATHRSGIEGEPDFLLMANLDIYNSQSVYISSTGWSRPKPRSMVELITREEPQPADFPRTFTLGPGGIIAYRLVD